ncbi:branched-chain amino acid ABC transporter permease [Bradyrhizobium sp. U531]|uniref:branched-chain amino acid ABC transporter permease n=1 Tax=Bradyrhizobium sp. U531 TaxID=3053458 RepID=UPI003F43DB87
MNASSRRPAATSIAAFGLVSALALVPILFPMFGANFWINVVAEILIWSLLAASVNLLLGYVGLLSFGQALYFGVGMYGVAIGISKLGLGLWPALGLGVAAATLMAALAGALAVRLTWHYFAIITVVFSLIFYFIAMSAKELTGGDDGINFSAPPLFASAGLSLSDRTTQYYFILLVTLACYILVALVVRSPLGLRFAAVRENESRARLIGINVYLTRWLAFVMAGALAGIGGGLFGLFGRYASASYMFYHVSGEAVVWAIVGGVGTLLGPLLGTALLIAFREVMSGIWENYLIAVGAITILVVMFAPQGMVGAFQAIWSRATGIKPDSTEER